MCPGQQSLGNTNKVTSEYHNKMQEIKGITRDGVNVDCFVKSPAPQACVPKLCPVSTDGSSSSLQCVRNRGKPTYCPTGSEQLRYNRSCSVKKLLNVCNPVTVSEEALSRIHVMLSTSWPSVTDEAKTAMPAFADLYQKVKSYNLPNCLGAKIPVISGLKIENWVELLKGYHDNELCHFLAYGWPIGYYSLKLPESVAKNHPSAVEYPEHIRQFIKTEKSFQAIEGPINGPPFKPWARISPLMTRPKKGSLARRVIVDLSFPEGSSVNTGIDMAEYLGRDISYTLPTITDLIAKLQVEGEGAFIWKADLARAYRQLRADPVDAPLLCVKFDNDIFIDRCPPFGCRSSSAACQRVANSIVYMMGEKKHHCLAYLDDFAGCSAQFQEANNAFIAFKQLAEYLGLELSDHKCFSPSTTVEWLGYSINTQEMTIAIPQHKLQEVISECSLWFQRKRVTKNMVQSLVGRLAHIANCVLPGRKFLARMLSTLRAFGEKKWTTIDDEFIKDVRWFYYFAVSFNGITLYSPSLQTVVIECDACLEGAGGNTDSHCYAWKYTSSYKELYPVIHKLEAINTLVAYRTLAHIISPGPVRALILTDNITSSQALMSGKTRDSILAACAREFWLEAAKNGDQIDIEHRPGASIPLADALSRFATDRTKYDYACSVVAQKKIVFVQPAINNYVFFDPSI